MATITVAVAYANPKAQYYQELQVALGTTVYEALQISGLLDLPCLAKFNLWCKDNQDKDPNHKAWYVGIYSQKCRLDGVLADGDRVEIYRPLSSDPMARRKVKSKKIRRKN